ncbi:uncharacterized protein LOC143229925 [Tachypleus tridentatus]|uniref:uncharacterized protein LOC143229925 n=1 Tax=Tachypleus tridentatus TaxID=6853 RepID=UPI003FD13811
MSSSNGRDLSGSGDLIRFEDDSDKKLKSSEIVKPVKNGITGSGNQKKDDNHTVLFLENNPTISLKQVNKTHEQKHGLSENHISVVRPNVTILWSFNAVRGKVTNHCIWSACKALTLGILFILLGTGMAVLGFYSTHPIEERKENRTKIVENFSRSYKLTSMTYIGPAVMGVGGIIIVATCVLVFEARDTAAKVIPLWLWPTHDHRILAVGSHVTKNTTSWEVFHARPKSVTGRNTDAFGFNTSLKVSSNDNQTQVLDHSVHPCLNRSLANWSDDKKANFQRLQMSHLTRSNRKNPKGQCLDVIAAKNIDSDHLRAQFWNRSKIRYQYDTEAKTLSCYVEKSPRKCTSEPNINEVFQSTDAVWTDENEIFDIKSSFFPGKMTLHPVNPNQQCLPNVPHAILKVHKANKVSNETVPIWSKGSDRFDFRHFYNTFQKSSIVGDALSPQTSRRKSSRRKGNRSKTNSDKRREVKGKHQKMTRAESSYQDHQLCYKSADRRHSLWLTKSPISSCCEDSSSQSTSTEYLLRRQKDKSSLYGSFLKIFTKKIREY